MQFLNVNKIHFSPSVLIIIIISTFFLFFNTLKGDFLNWDDTTYLINNSLMNQSLCLNSFYNIYQAEHHISFVLSTFLVQIQWFGVEPFGMHLFNLFFHLFNIILVYLLSRKLLKNDFYALFIALFFAIHPMRSETLGWIMQRKDIMYTFFFLLSTINFLAFIKTKSKYSLFLVLIFGTLSSLSKIQALALPFVLLILEYFVDKKITINSLSVFISLMFLQTNTFLDPLETLIFVVFPSIVCIFQENIKKFRFSYGKMENSWMLNRIIRRLNLLDLTLIFFILIFIYHVFKLSLNHTLELIKPIISLIILYLFMLHSKIRLKHKNIFLFIVIIIGLIGFYYLFTSKLSISLTQQTAYSFSTRIQFAFYSLSYYLIKFFAPFNLSAMHPYPDRPNVPISLLFQIAPFLIIGVVSIIVYFLVKIKNSILKQQIIFGLLFFMINISFVLHIIPIQGRVIVADRYTYLAYFGLLFSVIPIFGSIYAKFRSIPTTKYLFTSILYLIIIIFAYQTWSRNKVWKNDEMFWSDVIQKDKTNHYAHYSLALFYFENEQYQKSLGFYDKAIQNYEYNYEYFTNRGSCYVILKETTKAIDDFARAIELNPKNAYAYNNRGVLFLQIGDLRNALVDFQNAILLDSNYLEAKVNYDKTNIMLTTIETSSDNTSSNQEKAKMLNDIGVKKAMNNQFESSILDFNNAIMFDSLNINAYKNRGNAFASLKKFNEAMNDYNKVLTFTPNDAGIYMNIGNIKHQLNDKSACEYWHKAKSLGLKDAQQMIFKYCN